MFYYLLLLSILASLGYAEEQPQASLGDVLATAATLSGHPELAPVLKTMDALATQSSTTISDPYDQSGRFYDVIMTGDKMTGAADMSSFHEIVQELLHELPASQQATIVQAVKIYMRSLKDHAWSRQKFQIAFNDGHGHIALFALLLQPLGTNAVRYTILHTSTTYVPAPSWVIVTDSDCNLFGCDKADSIVYLPVTSGPEDIRAFVKLTVHLFKMMDKMSIM